MKKKTFIFSTLIFLAFTALYSQSIDINEVDLPLTKEAKKAAKKGNLYDGGIYTNSDSTSFYKFFLYQPRKSPMMYDLIVMDSSGEVKEVVTDEFNGTNLAKYNLEVPDHLEDPNSGGYLSGKKVGFFRSPVLANYPKLITGEFRDDYTNNVWSGYKFREEDTRELDTKFWVHYSYALQDENMRVGDNYLLQTSRNFINFLRSNRNYIPMDSRACIGGMKATSDFDTYITGIVDMSNGEWIVKNENKIFGGTKTSVANMRKTDGGIYDIIQAGDSFYVMEVDGKGNLVNQTQLSIKNPNDMRSLVKTQPYKNGILIMMGGGMRRGSDGIFVNYSLVVDGHEVMSQTINKDQMEAMLVEAPRSKSKFRRIDMLTADKFEKVNDKHNIMFFNANGGETLFAVYLNDNYDPVSAFMADGFKTVSKSRGLGNMGESAGHIPPLVETDNNGGLYWIMLNIPDGFEQGIQSNTTDGGYLITTTTFRIDQLFTQFKIAKINLNNNTISEVEEPEYILVGEKPYIKSKDGALLFSTLSPKKRDRVKLVVR